MPNFKQQRQAAAARESKINNAAPIQATNSSLDSKNISVSVSKGQGGTDVDLRPNKAYTTVKQGSLGGTSKS